MNVPAPEATADRTAVYSGHVVRVLQADGSAVEGVRVHFMEIEGLTELPRHVPFSAVYWIPPSHAGPARLSAVSDENGLVELPTRAGGVAHVTEDSFTGDVTLIEIDTEAKVQVHDLLLQPRKMVEVIVLDSMGDPIQSGFRLDVEVASVQLADALPEDAEPWERRQVWHVDAAIGFLADGRRMLSLDPDFIAAPKLGPEPGPLRHRLIFGSRIAMPEVREFERDVEGPIVFQIASTGELRLRVVDSPPGVIPQIQRSSDDIATMHPRELQPEDGWFRFTDVPLHAELAVSFRAHYKEDFSDLGYRLELSKIRIAGVSEPVIATERTVYFKWPPGFRGKFVFPDDDNFDRARFFDQVGIAVASTTLCIRGSHVFSERSSCSLFADGSFSIPVPAVNGSRNSVDDVWGFSMICADLEGNESIREVPWQAVRAWALVDAQMPAALSVVDLGDVPLQIERPRLKVLVVDADGDPIPETTVKPMYSCEKMSPDQLTDSSYEYTTDELGEVWFVGRNWYELIGFAEPGAKGEIFGAVTRRGVQIEHESFASVAQEIDASTREIEIQLAAAGSILGSVELCPELSRCRIVAVPPGATTRDQDNGPLSRDVVSMNRRTGVVLEYFSLDGVASGKWDVVFEVSKSTNLEVLRVQNVQVTAGEICRDPRLQNIDLRSLLRFAYVNFYDSTGRQLTAQEVSDASFEVQDSHSGGTSRRGAATVGNQVALLADTQEPGFPGAELYSHLYRRIVLDKVEEGQLDITVHAKTEVEVRIARYEDLPQGSQVTLSGWVFGESMHPFEASQLQSNTTRIGVEEVGELHLAVYLSGPDGAWQTKFEATVMIDSSHLEQNAPLVIEIPQATLDAISK